MPGLSLILPKGADFAGGMRHAAMFGRGIFEVRFLFLPAMRDKMGERGMSGDQDFAKMPCFWQKEAVSSGAFQFESLLVFHEHGTGLFLQCFHTAGEKPLVPVVRACGPP